MDVLNYKGFEIHAAPYRLAETGQWKINIDIARHTGDEGRFRNFVHSDSYPTREDAVEHCFQFGRQIIDGQVSNCSVTDL